MSMKPPIHIKATCPDSAPSCFIETPSCLELSWPSTGPEADSALKPFFFCPEKLPANQADQGFDRLDVRL